MESTLDPVLGAVLPVFGLVACGYLAGRFHIVTQASSQALNQFVHAIALPAMLFVAVYRPAVQQHHGEQGERVQHVQGDGQEPSRSQTITAAALPAP